MRKAVVSKRFETVFEEKRKNLGVISNGTSLEHFVPNGTLTSQLFLMGLPLVNMRIIGSH